MNDGVTISTFQMFEMFPTQEHARVYLESRLWPNGPQCPVCGLGERITVRKGGFYRCNQCQEDFTVRTGTIFERSHIPLRHVSARGRGAFPRDRTAKTRQTGSSGGRRNTRRPVRRGKLPASPAPRGARR